MLEKAFGADSWDFGMPAVALVKVARDGMGPGDRRLFEKRAAAGIFADRLRDFRPGPGDIPLHILAVGATEGYGCFPAGTPVQTAKGLRAIETIQVGEQVLTHRGRYRPVISLFNRQFSGTKIVIRVSGLPETLTCTDNHPIQVVRAADFRLKDRAACFRKVTGRTLESVIDESLEKACFVRADQVRPGDFVIVPAQPEYAACKLPLDQRIPQARSWTTGKFTLYPVREVVRLPAGSAETVYNLETAEDASYVTLFSVHNSNRNGDGFCEKTCQLQHPTFVKHAKHYLHHKNKNPGASYGPVKFSAYNPKMRRIELLVLANGTKEAAARNGGLVLPDAEQEILHRGDPYPTSMACVLPFDVCQNCFNKAASRREYCTEDTCISPRDGHRGLGCATGLTKLSSAGRLQYVENPDCVFKDISRVVRPADRNAYGGVADYLAKAASADHAIGGAELAELYAAQNGYSLDFSPDGNRVARQLKLAHELAQVEQEVSQGKAADCYMALGRAKHALDLRPIGPLGTKRASLALGALAWQQVMLTPQDFLRLVSRTDDPEKLAAYEASLVPCLPGVFCRLVTDPELVVQLRTNVFSPDLESLPGRDQREWAAKSASTHSLQPRWSEQRLLTAALQQEVAPRLEVTKQAAEDPGDALARQYALYQLAMLDAVPRDSQTFPLTIRQAIVQNYTR